MKTRPCWISPSSAAPLCPCHSHILRPPPDRSKPWLLASKLKCSGALHGGVRAGAGAFAGRSEGWRRGAGPWHRGSAYASNRGCWHRGQRHCLYGAPVARAQVLQALQALRRSLVAHVEPQRLVGLAVVHDGLFVSVEGQRAQLVGDLHGETWGAQRKVAGGKGETERKGRNVNVKKDVKISFQTTSERTFFPCSHLPNPQTPLVVNNDWLEVVSNRGRQRFERNGGSWVV